jgi:hypothetical protein
MSYSMLSPAAFVVAVLAQVLLIVHCIKTGRNTIWIWVLVLLPLGGAIAYLAVEVLPELFRSRTTRRAVRGVRRALDPQQDLRRLENAARVSSDVATRQRYADELARQGRHAEAMSVYRQALTGLYEHDPNLMLGLARAQFGAGDAAAARATLDELIARNPQFRSPEGHLLYARALESEGRTEAALSEYATLAQYYAGAEARLRYGQLLRRAGRADEARRVLEELLDHARIAPGHYRKAQRDWLDAAQRELAEIG